MKKLFGFTAANEKTQEPVKSDDLALVSEIKRVRERLDVMNSLFNLTCDSDMIDYYIHEINALDARYRYLLRLIRANQVKCPTGMFSIDPEERVYEKLG